MKTVGPDPICECLFVYIYIHIYREVSDDANTTCLLMDNPRQEVPSAEHFRLSPSTMGLGSTWTPKLFRIIAFWALFRGLGHYLT